jgi:hypothetical protein
MSNNSTKHSPMASRRQLVLGLWAAGLAAAGCGGGSDATPSPAPNPPTSSPPPPGSPPPSAPPPAPPPPPLPPPVTVPGPLLAALTPFAETAARNWNFEGHSVPTPFDSNQGWWDYTNTTYEPWLFDRAEVWRLLAEMTNSDRWRAQATSDLDYYESRLSADGIFLNKQGEADTKYSYVHTWSTRPAVQLAAYRATVSGFPDRPNLSPTALWTERELWVALDAATKYHAISGSAQALARARAMLDQWDTVCAGRGAALVTYTQHEGGGPGGTQPTDLVTSPWMSALYFQAARAFIARVPTHAAQVHRQASDYFDWLDEPAHKGFHDAGALDAAYAGLVFPAYLAGGTAVGDAAPSESNMDHAVDVAGLLAFVVRAKTELGLPTATAQRRLNDMKASASVALADATRSTLTLPKYRLRPPRKFNWWVRGAYELWSHSVL